MAELKINFSRVGGDADDESYMELAIKVANGQSSFVNKVGTNTGEIGQLIDILSSDCLETAGVELGRFGKEYAYGACLIHVSSWQGKFHVVTQQQSDFEKLGSEHLVADEVRINLLTERVLLDNFVDELKRLNSGVIDSAELFGVKGIEAFIPS